MKILSAAFLLPWIVVLCLGCKDDKAATSPSDTTSESEDSPSDDSDLPSTDDTEGSTDAMCSPDVATLITEDQETALKEFPVDLRASGCTALEASVRMGDEELYLRGAPMGDERFRAYVPLKKGDNALDGVVFANGGTALELGRITIKYTPTTPLEDTGSGFITGRVTNGATEKGIAAVSVYVRDVQGELETDDDGTFRFPTPGGGRFLVTVEAEGYTFAQRWVRVSAGETADLDAVALMPLDSVTAQVTPEDGGTLTNSTKDVTLSVPEGAVKTAVEVSAVNFKMKETLPSPLPDSSRWTQAFNLSPDGVRFGKPSTVRMKNDLGFAPGTPVPVGYYDRSAAAWVPETMGTVTADGKWIEAQIRHFSPYDCNFPTSENGRPGVGSASDDDCENGRRGSSIVSDLTGRLSLFVPFTEVQRRGRPVSFRLVYESERAENAADLVLPIDLASVANLERMEGTLSLGNETLHLGADAANGETVYIAGGTFAGVDDGAGTGLGRILSARLGLKALARTTYLNASRFGAPGTSDTKVETREPVPFDVQRTFPVAVPHSEKAPMGAGWSFDREETLLVSRNLGLAAHLRPGRTSFISLGVMGDEIGRTDASSDSALLFDFFVLDSGEVVLVDTQSVRIAPSLAALNDAEPLYEISDGTEIVAAAKCPDGRIVVVGSFGFLNWIDPLSGDIEPYDLASELMTWAMFHGDAEAIPFMIAVARGNGLAVDRDGVVYVAAEGFGLVGVQPEGDGHTVLPIPLTGGADTVPSASALAYVESEHALYILDRFAKRIIRYDLNAKNETVYADARDLPGIEDGGMALRMAARPDGTLYYTTNIAFGRFTPDRLQVPLSSPTFGPLAEARCAPERVGFDGDAPVLLCTRVDESENRATFFPLDPDAGNDLKTGARLTLTSDESTLTSGSETRRFDTEGRLIFVERAEGTAALAYDDEGALTEYTDPSGYRLDFTYTGGTLSKIEDNAGRAWQISVSAEHDLGSVTDGDGVIASFSYDDHLMTARDVDGARVTYAWDDAHRIDTTQIEGQAPRTYRSVLSAVSAVGGIVPVTEAGAKMVLSDGAGIENTVEHRLDAKGRLAGIVTDDDIWTVSYLDDFGRMDAGDGSVQSVILRDPEGVPSLFRSKNGRLVGFGQDDETIYEMTFDEDGLPLGESGVGDACQYSYDDPQQRLTEVQCSGFYAEYTYTDDDALPDRLTSWGGYDWGITYDDHGNPLTIEDPEGGMLTYTRNEVGYVIRVTDERGGVTDIERNDRGLVTALREPGRDWTRFTWAQGAACENCPDHRVDRISSMTDPLGQTWAFDLRADGNVASVTDPEGRVRTTEFDGQGRVVGIQPGQGTERVEVRYTQKGELAAVDNGADADTFEYDALSRIVRAENAETLLTRTYDDDAHTVTETVEDKTTGVTRSVAWRETYHKIESFTSSVGHNQIVATPRAWYMDGLLDNGSFAGSTSFGFSLNWGGGDFGERLSYDVGDVLVSDVDVYHDSLDRIYEWYEDIGADSNDSRSDGFYVTYDGSSRLMTGLEAVSGELFPSVSYTYDASRRLTAFEAVFEGQPEYAATYGYDDVGRLAAHTDLGTLTYDTSGALLSTDLATYAVDGGGARESRTDKTSGAITRYTFNGREQLRRIETFAAADATNPTTAVAFAYDAQGRLSRMEANGETIHYLWLDQVLLAELDEAGEPIRRYIPAERLDRVSIINVDDANYFVADDPMGTVHRLVSADGTVEARFDLDPWGKLLHGEGTLADCPRRFLGMLQIDAAGGLIYMRNRWYDPEVGQFLSRDPLFELTASPQPTMYARNNPVYFCDQEGLCPDATSAMYGVTRDAVITGSQFTNGTPGTIAGAAGNVYVFARGLQGYDGTMSGNARAGMQNYASIIGLDQSPAMRNAMNRFSNFAENGLDIATQNQASRMPRSNCDFDSLLRWARARIPVFEPCP